jgi:hypothetical protein
MIRQRSALPAAVERSLTLLYTEASVQRCLPGVAAGIYCTVCAGCCTL